MITVLIGYLIIHSILALILLLIGLTTITVDDISRIRNFTLREYSIHILGVLLFFIIWPYFAISDLVHRIKR